MPNWCYSDITIYSKDKEIITDLYNKLSEWLDAPTLMPDAWGGDSTWLGNILLHAGFSAEEVLDTKNTKLRCRGTIQDEPAEINVVNGYSYFNFSADTAWSAKIEMWYSLLEKLYPGKDIRIAYSAEEPNMAEYYKWDPDNLFYAGEDYYMDFSKDGIADEDLPDCIKELFTGDDYQSDHISRDIAVQYMQRILNTNESDEDKLLELMEAYDEEFSELSGDAYIHFYKFDICRTENG